MATITLKKSFNLAEVEVSYKTKIKASERAKISKSQDAYDILKSILNYDSIEHREEFVIILLTKANGVLGWCKISSGGVSGTVVDPKLIFQIALNCNASGIIMAHNHPSGDTKPSNADIQLTKRIKNGAELLDIKLLDHLIITDETYLSLADQGDC